MKLSIPTHSRMVNNTHAFLDTNRNAVYYYEGELNESEDPDMLELLKLVKPYLDLNLKDREKSREKIYEIAKSIKNEGKDEKILDTFYQKNCCRQLFKETTEVNFNTLFEKTRSTLGERQPVVLQMECSRPILKFTPQSVLLVEWKNNEKKNSVQLNQGCKPEWYEFFIRGKRFQIIKEGVVQMDGNL